MGDIGKAFSREDERCRKRSDVRIQLDLGFVCRKIEHWGNGAVHSGIVS